MKNYSLLNSDKSDVEKVTEFLGAQETFCYNVLPVRLWSCFPYPEHLLLLISSIKKDEMEISQNENPVNSLKKNLCDLAAHNIFISHFGFKCVMEFEINEKFGEIVFNQMMKRFVRTAPMLLNVALVEQNEKLSGYILFHRKERTVIRSFMNIFKKAKVRVISSKEIFC